MKQTLLGILNCDVGASPLEPHNKRLMEICNLYQYHQTIVEPTRVTKNTATIIDLFITNNPNMYAHSRVLSGGNKQSFSHICDSEILYL